MKVYVLLCWFWEGDGYLVNSYKDCYKSLKDAQSEPTIEHESIIYLPGERIPEEEDGSYYSDPFYQIIEKTL
jgi:hypothetical protein